MSAITRGAIKAIKFYKHVVHSVEKFIQKCKPEYKVPGLYVIDSIVRQSRHQFGQDKDVFAPRFAKNMQQTFANLFRCPPEDKRNIIRVLNLWQKNNVFGQDVIQPLMDMADPNHPLHKEIELQQQQNSANGSSLNVSHGGDSKISPAAASQHTPHASTPMGDQFQDQSSQPSGVKFNRKLLNDFEYDSEDDSGTPHQPSHQSQHQGHQQAQQPTNPADALGSILTNPEIMRQLQSLQAQMQLMTGMQIPNLQNVMPMVTDMQFNQQNQNVGLPFLGGPMEMPKLAESQEDPQNDPDIEFVETGPQVIEIPDANDSRTPSPSRRRRSRSPRRRRRGSRSRSRSRSPRRRRDREREREREKEKEKKEPEKSFKESLADREKQKEREKKGLPPIKKDNLSVCSTTLWVGHLSKLATQEELFDLFGSVGGVTSIDVVGPRGCAFVVMERRRDAAKAKQKLDKYKLHSKEITVAWAPGKGVKGREWKDYWEGEHGVSYLPWDKLQQQWRLGLLSMDALEEGGAVDEETQPRWLPPRILPKAMMDSTLGGMLGMPPAPGPGMMPNLPPGLAGLQSGALSASMAANIPLPGAAPGGTPGGLPAMGVPRLPLPGMPAGLPPGLAAALPGIRPPGMPTVPGGLLGFPPGMPPQTMPPQGLGQPGMVPNFLSGLMGLGGLMPGLPPLLARGPPPAQEVTHTDDAMDLDDEGHTEGEESAPPPLPEQLQALLSKPPPAFNASEPPPPFNASEPPPFNAAVPPPADGAAPDGKTEDDKKDRDRDRRDRDRSDRGDRRDRDRDGGRDRRERDRDGGRDGGRDRDNRRDRGGRDRDRDRERSRGRAERDRGERGERGERRGERESRFGSRDNNTRERSPHKSPARNQPNEQTPGSEKTLQERLWELANGNQPLGQPLGQPPGQPPGQPERQPEEDNDDFNEPGGRGGDSADTEAGRRERPPIRELMSLRHDHPPPLLDAPDMSKQPDSGWQSVPPPRQPPPMAPTFRAELRMRGPRAPVTGPWMEGPPGPNFGPRFNGMGPPPFNRPPFDGPPRFERPPFNRPFDGPRPLFDGSRPPFDGSRPPFDGSRPPFDGSRPPFDGSRPPFDGPMPPFDGPPFDGPPFDGPPFDDGDMPFDGPPRFDGPPEFFDRNRRFDDREQFNDRGWNGDRDRDWGDNRRNDWDERRRDRRRGNDQEERFNRSDNRSGDRNDNRSGDRNDNRSGDRNDRKRNFDDKSAERTKEKSSERAEKPAEQPTEKTDEQKRQERKERRDKDRKSRWGAAEDIVPIEAEPTPDNVQNEAMNEPTVMESNKEAFTAPEKATSETTSQQDTSSEVKSFPAVDTHIAPDNNSNVNSNIDSLPPAESSKHDISAVENSSVTETVMESFFADSSNNRDVSINNVEMVSKAPKIQETFERNDQDDIPQSNYEPKEVLPEMDVRAPETNLYDEPKIRETYEQNIQDDKQQSNYEPKEVVPERDVRAPVTNLYDEPVDTSFATPVEKQMPQEPVFENPVFDEPKSAEIFFDEKIVPQTAEPIESSEKVESKESEEP